MNEIGKSVAGVRAVLFDFGQVLSQGPNVNAWERLRGVAGGDPERFHGAYWRYRHAYDRGDLDGTAYWHAVAKDAGHAGLNADHAGVGAGPGGLGAGPGALGSGAGGLGADELEALYLGDTDLWGDLNLPMVRWAGRLQDRGIKTGILSNIGDRMEAGIRERFPWIERFDHCIWSHALRMAKPERAIYLRAADGLLERPEAVLFVDDRADNVEAAREAGMLAVQYGTHARFEAEMRDAGLGELL